MGQGGRDFSFQSSFSFIAVSHFFRADIEIYSIYLRVSNVRVIGAHRRLRCYRTPVS
jgi:hypothetical protein